MFIFEMKKRIRKHSFLFLLLMGIVIGLARFGMPDIYDETVHDFPANAFSQFVLPQISAEISGSTGRKDLKETPNLQNADTYFSDINEWEDLGYKTDSLAAKQEKEGYFRVSREERAQLIQSLLRFDQATLDFFETHLQKLPQYQSQWNLMKTLAAWHQTEANYALRHDVPLAYRTFIGVLKQDNLASFLYQNFPFYFGLVFFLLLAICFHPIFSQERESGTLNLLWTQPVHRFRILLAKIGTILVGVLVYALGIFSGATVGCLLTQKNVGGFRLLLRYLTTTDSVQGIPIGIALLEMMVGVLALTVFFGGILLLLSLHFSSAVSLGCSVLLLTVSHLLTSENLASLHPLNPMALMDYLRAITGRTDWGTNSPDLLAQGQTAWGVAPYLLWAGIGVLLLGLALIPVREKKAKEKKKAHFSTIQGLSDFVWKKLVDRPVFRLYLAGAVLLSGLLFFINEYPAKHAQNHPELNSDFYSQLDDSAAFWEEAIAYEKSPEGQAEFLGVSVDDLPPIDEWNIGDRANYFSDIDFYQTKLREDKRKKEAYLDVNQAFFQGDGKTFWKAYNVTREDLYNQGSYTSYYSKSGKLGSFSFSLTRRIIDEASRRNTPPIWWPMTLIANAQEGFSGVLSWSTQRSEDIALTPSGIYWIYQLMIVYRLPWIFLVLVGLMLFAGYSLDKEEGDQLALLWTQPLSRMRYHLTLVGKQFVLGVLLLLFLLLFNLALGCLFEGIGPWNFPLPFYTGFSDKVGFISLWLFLLKTVGLLIAYLFFYSALSVLLSLFVRQPAHVFMGLLGITGAGLLVTHFLPAWGKSLLPFSYLASDMVADGSLFLVEPIAKIPFAGSLFVVIFWGVVLLGIGMGCAKKLRQF